MQILSYKTFKNNNDFVEWQLEKERKISQVTPIMNSANISEQTVNTVNGIAFGCFVLYFDEVATQDTNQ